MEKKDLIIGVVGLTVCVIVAATVLMPILNDATTTHETFTNKGVFYYGIFTPDDEYTLEYDDGTITVNDTVVTPIQGVDLTHYGSYSVISTDNMLFRFGSNNNGYYVQIVGNDKGGNNVLLGASTATVTISSGDLVVTTGGDNPQTKTFTFTEMYAIVPNVDDAILKASTGQVYIKGDSQLYASGLTTVSAWNNMFHFEGTYDDGITISSPNLPGCTFDNIVWNIEPVSGYVDLYKLTSIEFDIINNDTTVHATYSYFGVPSEVTAEKSQHLDSGSIAIINAIPIIIIVAMIAMAVGFFLIRRE